MKPWDDPAHVKRDQKMCPNCKIVVYHKPERCIELEINKGKRRDNWKSVLWHGEGTWTVVGSKTKTNVQDSVKNKLARSDVLHDYWSSLKWLDDKPEHRELKETKRQNMQRNEKRDRRRDNIGSKKT